MLNPMFAGSQGIKKETIAKIVAKTKIAFS
jgi:hypothetical protein